MDNMLNLNDKEEVTSFFNDAIKQHSVDIGFLSDWYINSVYNEDIPSWISEHLCELDKDFYCIPKDVVNGIKIETTEITTNSLKNKEKRLNLLTSLSSLQKEDLVAVIEQLQELLSENPIKLPCKVGDVIWQKDNIFNIFPYVPYPLTITSISVTTNGIYFICDEGNRCSCSILSSEIGKSVFLTKEEALKQISLVE